MGSYLIQTLNLLIFQLLILPSPLFVSTLTFRNRGGNQIIVRTQWSFKGVFFLSFYKYHEINVYFLNLWCIFGPPKKFDQRWKLHIRNAFKISFVKKPTYRCIKFSSAAKVPGKIASRSQLSISLGMEKNLKEDGF